MTLGTLGTNVKKRVPDFKGPTLQGTVLANCGYLIAKRKCRNRGKGSKENLSLLCIQG